MTSDLRVLVRPERHAVVSPIKSACRKCGWRLRAGGEFTVSPMTVAAECFPNRYYRRHHIGTNANALVRLRTHVPAQCSDLRQLAAQRLKRGQLRLRRAARKLAYSSRRHEGVAPDAITESPSYPPPWCSCTARACRPKWRLSSITMSEGSTRFRLSLEPTRSANRTVISRRPPATASAAGCASTCSKMRGSIVAAEG